MKALKILNEENVSDEELENFKVRRAARAFVIDNEGKIAFNYMEVDKYYELPGGGVEEGETYEEGLIREAREEAGCDVQILNEVGIIKEYRKEKSFVNETHAYIAKVVGDKKDLILTEGEARGGMTVQWVTVEKALELIKTVNKPKRLYDEYLVIRDITIIEEAKKLIKEIN